MVGDFPYTPKPDDLVKLMTLLPTIEVPEAKADSLFVKSLGFTIASSKHLYNILKLLGFIDASDRATEVWKDYRTNEQRGRVLAARIKQAYFELFEKIFCPYLEDDSALYDFFNNRVKATPRELDMLIEAFRILSEYADFQDVMEDSGFNGLLTSKNLQAAENMKELKVKVDPNLQVNIQVLIDPNTSDEKIETIFKNMRKFLLGKDG
jgi:hypothetical protein